MKLEGGKRSNPEKEPISKYISSLKNDMIFTS